MTESETSCMSSHGGHMVMTLLTLQWAVTELQSPGNITFPFLCFSATRLFVILQDSAFQHLPL